MIPSRTPPPLIRSARARCPFPVRFTKALALALILFGFPLNAAFAQFTVRAVEDIGKPIVNINEAETLLDSRPTVIAKAYDTLNFTLDSNTGLIGGDLPWPSVSGTHFAVEAVGVIDVIGGVSVTASFVVNSDDGFRLRINGVTVQEFFGPRNSPGTGAIPGSLTLKDGDVIRLTYFQATESSSLELLRDADGTLTTANDLTLVGSAASGIDVVPFLQPVSALDDFESYAIGSPVEGGPNGLPDGIALNGGSGFHGPYDVSNAHKANLSIGEPSLSYRIEGLSMNAGPKALQIADAANANDLLSRPFPAQSGPVYFSFLYGTLNPSASSEDFVQIGLSDSPSDGPEVSVGTGNTGFGNAPPPRFFTRVPSDGATALSDLPLNELTTYFLVGKASKVNGSTGYNRIDLYINPATLAEPATPTVTAVSPADPNPSTLSHFNVRAERLDAGDRYFLDRLAIGNDYSSVVPRCPAKGDANGDSSVDVGDAVRALQVIVGVETSVRPNGCVWRAMDVNCDEELNVQDPILILRKIAFGEPFPTGDLGGCPVD